MKTKIVFVLVLMAFLIGVYMNEDAGDINLNDLNKSYEKIASADSMEQRGGRDMKQWIGINPRDCESFIYYSGKDALSVDELLIVKTETRERAESLEDAVDSRIDSQIVKYESYGIQQTAKLKNAVVIQKGKYLFYYVGDKSEDYEEVFRDAI